MRGAASPRQEDFCPREIGRGRLEGAGRPFVRSEAAGVRAQPRGQPEVSSSSGRGWAIFWLEINNKSENMSCEVEDFAGTRVCKLCLISRPCVLLVV